MRKDALWQYFDKMLCSVAKYQNVHLHFYKLLISTPKLIKSRNNLNKIQNTKV